ncbi:hypothetical protein, conserved [Eimeria praecox]|uniref:Uncharacterized protein n=1 Tax=Eimeria praecox TaxID=51316 RepID=U6H4P4_9EIME|nr:hypothetical protein, conserved [Eimeria praecox]
MEDPTTLLKGKAGKPYVAASTEYDNLYQLELMYWSIKTLRKTTSVKAHVGNALLFAGFHIKSLVYSSCLCAISAALLKCIGLQTAPMNFGAVIACACLIMLQLLLQPIPLGGFWAVCVATFLLFIVGSEQLLAALAEGVLPKGVFAFVGFSCLWWLSPLIAAAVLAAILLLCHYLELFLAVSRGGYHIFCPPNPHLFSLDDLAGDAVQGRPLSLSLSKPRSPPSVAAFAQLFREKLSPRVQGPAMAQQRRTVGSPVSAASGPAATGQEAVVAERKLSGNPPHQKKPSSEGAWLVALWLRGPFFLASFGALCIAGSVGLYAVASDSAAASHGIRGPAVFDSISRLLLPMEKQPMHQIEASFAAVQHQDPPAERGASLTRNFLQRQQQLRADVLLPEDLRHRWEQRNKRFSTVLQARTPLTEDFLSDPFRNPSVNDPYAEATPGNSFLHIRLLDGAQRDEAHRQHGRKSAAALLLLALVLFTPLLGTSLAEWIEDIFFAHMVLIKRNPWMIVPPPTVSGHPQGPVIEPIKATESASASTNESDPLLHVAQERMTHQTPQNFLGLDTQLAREQQPEQQRGKQTDSEQA